MTSEPTFILIVTDCVPKSEENPEGFKDTGTVYFTREKGQEAYRKAVDAGCYGASLCLVLESTDYF